MAEGIVVVASAGNDGVCRPAYPAAFDGVVSVAALGPDGPAPFSNWGSWVRACAPGVDVASTFYIGNCAGEGEVRRRPRHLHRLGAVVGDVVRRSRGGRRARPHHDVGGPDRPTSAVEAIIDQAGLFRLRCYGTVVNALAVRPF